MSEVQVHCGTTKSGKVIWYQLSEPYNVGGKRSFPVFDSAMETFEAFALFRYLAEKERVLTGNGGVLAIYRMHYLFYGQSLSEIVDFPQFQKSLGIRSLKDLLDFGKARALPNYR